MQGMRELVRGTGLGRTLEDFEPAPLIAFALHHNLGFTAQKQMVLVHGVPWRRARLGRSFDRGRRPRRVFGGRLFASRASRNFVVTGVPNETYRRVVASWRRSAFRSRRTTSGRIRSQLQPAEPHCNFPRSRDEQRLAASVLSPSRAFRRPDVGSTPAPRRLPARLRATRWATSASRATTVKDADGRRWPPTTSRARLTRARLHRTRPSFPAAPEVTGIETGPSTGLIQAWLDGRLTRRLHVFQRRLTRRLPLAIACLDPARSRRDAEEGPPRRHLVGGLIDELKRIAVFSRSRAEEAR